MRSHAYDPLCLCKPCRRRGAGYADHVRTVLDEEDDEQVREIVRARLEPEKVVGEMLRARNEVARQRLAIEQAHSYLSNGLIVHAERALSSALGAAR